MNEYDKKFEKGMRNYVEMTYDWDKEKEVLDTMKQCQRNYDYEKWNNRNPELKKHIINQLLYVAQNSFANLRKNVNQAKAMLDSWIVRDGEGGNSEDKPLMEPAHLRHQPRNSLSGDPQKDAKDYLWLFSGLK